MATTDFRDRHIELVEAVNAAETEREHSWAECTLRGFREGVCMVTGIHPGELIMDADTHYLDQGIDRPMCGGIFCDWKPAKRKDNE